MEYQVEELSPVKKQVTVKVSADEVNAALGATTAFFRKDLKISGFRKGKVPSSIVENRFKKEIYDQASRDLLNVHFNQIFGELNLTPVSGIDVDAKELIKNQNFTYSFSFEFLPEIDLPEYHGLTVTQKKPSIPDGLLDSVIERTRKEQSELVVLKEERKPKDGDVAVIDFQAYEGETPLEEIQAKSFQLPLGEGGALPDFEAIIKDLVPGQTGEGQVTFPEDFINPDFANKTVTMKVTLNVIKERKLPELNDEFASRVGGYKNVDEMRAAYQKNLLTYFENLEKSNVQKKLLDILMEKIEVPLPESLVKNQIEQMVENRKITLESKGKSLESEGGEGALREKFRPTAEELVKSQLILLAIAKKEELSVEDQEVEQHIFRLAIESGQDPKALRDYYESKNLMFALRDKLLADKAMELVYEHADIKIEEPQNSEADAGAVEKDEQVSSNETSKNNQE